LFYRAEKEVNGHMSVTDVRHIRSRHEMVRYFDGYATDGMEEREERRPQRPFVKTHLIELLGGSRVASVGDVQRVLGGSVTHLTAVDDGLYLVTNRVDGEAVGFVERLRPRILAFYSALLSAPLDKLVRHMVLSSAELDYVWLSGLTFRVLWDSVTRLSHPRRFSELVFTHDSIYDVDGGPCDLTDDENSIIEGIDGNDDSETVVERRATRVKLVDRVGEIQRALESLQGSYPPFYAISRLRFPSSVGPGGHDFWDNGKVVNRSGSFRDHRSYVLYVTRIYEKLLQATEQRTWYSIEKRTDVAGAFRRIVGAPLTVRFQDPLSPDVFDCWIASTFRRKNNRFRLWGHPIRLGPTKVHVYGVDRHLWQPVFLELTARGCTAIIPNGTCGNTVHRLVTNIQRYLDPGAEVFLGDQPYKDIVEASSEGVYHDPEA
jgi:hypothetical protein